MGDFSSTATPQGDGGAPRDTSSDTDRNSGKVDSGFGVTTSVLGVAVLAVAVISLVENWADIQLAAIPEQFLTYYRQLFRMLVDWIPFPGGWRLPQWYLDAVAVSGVLSMAGRQAIAMVGYHQEKGFRKAMVLSVPACLSFVVVPFLVEFVARFARSTIKEAGGRLAGYESQLSDLKKTHPGERFEPLEESVRDEQQIIAEYMGYLAVRRKLLYALLSCGVATVAFFLLDATLT